MKIFNWLLCNNVYVFDSFQNMITSKIHCIFKFTQIFFIFKAPLNYKKSYFIQNIDKSIGIVLNVLKQSYNCFKIFHNALY